MNSGRTRQGRTLAGSSSISTAAKLLAGLANLRDDDLKWLQRKFPSVLEDLKPPETRMEGYTEENEGYPYWSTPRTPEGKWKYWVLPLRETLRRIWREPDRRTKEWGMFRLSQEFF